MMRQPVGAPFELAVASAARPRSTTATASGVRRRLLLEQLVQALVLRIRPPPSRSIPRPDWRAPPRPAAAARDSRAAGRHDRPPAAPANGRPAARSSRASNRSVAYSKRAAQPAASRLMQVKRQIELGRRRVSADLAAAPARAARSSPAARSAARTSPGTAAGGSGSRSGCSSSTSFSNGRSWCA